MLVGNLYSWFCGSEREYVRKGERACVSQLCQEENGGIDNDITGRLGKLVYRVN